jgi:Enhanced disease susceptibility 1 protein EP domain
MDDTVKQLKALNWEEECNLMYLVTDYVTQHSKNSPGNQYGYLLKFMSEEASSPINVARKKLKMFWEKVFDGSFPLDHAALNEVRHQSGILQRAINYFNLLEPFDEALFKKISSQSYWNNDNRPFVYVLIDERKKAARKFIDEGENYLTKRERLAVHTPGGIVTEQDAKLFLHEFESRGNRPGNQQQLPMDTLYAQFMRPS